MTNADLRAYRDDIARILGYMPSDPNVVTCGDLARMFKAGLMPVEAAMAIAVAEFERSLR